MRNEQATKVVMLIAAWVLGALMGSQVHRPAAASNASPHFKPGRYLIHSADGATYLYVTFDSNWAIDPW